MLGWAVVFGVAAPFAGEAIHRLAVWLRARIEPRMLLLMPVAGAVIGGIAIGFAEATDHEVSDVLFSGPGRPRPAGRRRRVLVGRRPAAADACKGLAYSISLSSFRGGPIFPALYIGAAAGVAASHLPGMELVPAVAMGIGAMRTVMLKLPMTSALFPTILLGSEGAQVVPVVVIAVVVAYVISIRLAPAPPAEIARSG